MSTGFEDNHLTDSEARQLLQRIGQRIKEKRISKGITQAALAKSLSVQKASLSRIEHGKTNISVFTLHKIATALQINESELLNTFLRANTLSFESVVLLQAKYRRTGDALKQLATELHELFVEIRACDNHFDKMRLHEVAREMLARRSELIAKLHHISAAMLKS